MVLLKIRIFYSDAVSSGGWLATLRRILKPSSIEPSCLRKGINVFETVITLPGRYEASLAATTPCRLWQCTCSWLPLYRGNMVQYRTLAQCFLGTVNGLRNRFASGRSSTAIVKVMRHIGQHH